MFYLCEGGLSILGIYVKQTQTTQFYNVHVYVTNLDVSGPFFPFLKVLNVLQSTALDLINHYVFVK